ncbi:MAG: hypothetical protein Q9220_003877 [cf. Caloplaca sp. 1 TL-2023]
MGGDKQVEDGSAPWFDIPNVHIVGIEHPCLLTDTGRAVESLGGRAKVAELIGEKSGSVEADLHLHPGSLNFRPIPSFNTKTSNLLVKIIVPKRIGRKRKNVSDHLPSEVSGQPPPKRPFLSRPDDTRRLVRSMRDHPDGYQVELLGTVAQSHRYRRLPDFVWSSGQSTFMTKMKDHILPFQYPALKTFKFDMSKGVQEKNDIIPPPRWAAHSIPFNYSYRQNPIAQPIFAPIGTSTKRSTQSLQLNKIPMLSHDTGSIPTEPPDGLPAEDSLPASFRALLEAIRKLFIDRPICTRRVLQNLLPADIWKAVGPNAAKFLWQYVGYLWNSGPWRDSICALGVDPRKDKAMRWYQTVMFQLEPEPMDTRADKAKVTRTRADRQLTLQGKNRESHIFDGSTVGLDGKLWQICDITDSLLRSMLETETLRDQCHEASDGWYPNGIWAKIRIIMKTKLGSILAGEVVGPEQDQEFRSLHERIPDVLTAENRSRAVFEKNSLPRHMMRVAEQIRTLASKQITGDSSTLNPDVVQKQPRRPLGGGVMGRVTYKSSRGGRPRKNGRGGARSNVRNEINLEVNKLDPRLRDATDALAAIEREKTMRAFEDDNKGSNGNGGEDEDIEMDEAEDNKEDDDDLDQDGDGDEDEDEDEDGDEVGASTDGANEASDAGAEVDDPTEESDAGSEDDAMLSE